MRLNHEQVETIRHTAAEVFGVGTKVWLFGSRVDDSKRGGDIDLLVRPAAFDTLSPVISKVQFLKKLEAGLGERKIDVVVEAAIDTRPIVKIAHKSGVLL